VIDLLLAALFASCGIAGCAAVMVAPFARVESYALRAAFLAVGFGAAACLILR
jgi:hypothetical protein